PASPFSPQARFVEMDATCARFDERGIADPLIGSVHDPIYQGAGPLGVAGVPQPKPGAVTKAHGGVLFLDEIGELHPVQLNRLLKVLEDRRVLFESAYYSPEDPNVPKHIKDIFENGLPADFRLIGATTRSPEEIAPAIRSRCVEVFFHPLWPEELAQIAANATAKIGFSMEPEALEVVRKYAGSGRDAVNMVQLAAGLAQGEGRKTLRKADLEWVAATGHLSPRHDVHPSGEARVGVAYGLAVSGPHVGTALEIEAVAHYVGGGRGQVRVTGVVEEEELGAPGRVLRRKALGVGAVESVLTALGPLLESKVRDYEIHVNWPGGVPVDGPSGGAPLAVAICSALLQIPVQPLVAFTGEVSVRGEIRPVGGIVAKVQAARRAGFRRLVIPAENMQESLAQSLAGAGLDLVPVRSLPEVLSSGLASPTGLLPSVVGRGRAGARVPGPSGARVAGA
ncbi:MAG TPA: sigma 54-interacting transcriptional regulator, partial [Firmicutes bacterium]|nr:sigma 54-interacting transcriptional regulator [Bacillota bacterium]